MTKDTKISEAGPPMLVNIALDLQLLICTFLHPSDILALRKTCKTLQLVTRRRIVWVTALHRVCFDNSLFLPSFPIQDMSDVELERAAMAPRMWIQLCVSFAKQHLNDSAAKLRPKTTRVVGSLPADVEPAELFIVPGGRYMVSYSDDGIFVWDLGYTSSTDCKLIASIGPEDGFSDCMVQATQDGMGLVILACHSREHYSVQVYEIYPQSETPQLTRIARLHLPSTRHSPACLLPDRVLWRSFCADKIVFRVWDYRRNYSTSFSADADIVELGYIEVIATKTAIFVLCEEGVFVWAIPPLSSQPPDFSDHNPIHIPSLFGIAFPYRILHQAELVGWQRISHWYCGSSGPLYFDILCRDSILHRFQIIVKPNLLDTTLHLIFTELVPHDFDDVMFQPYSICEDSLVACWHHTDSEACGAYTGSTSSRSPLVSSRDFPAAKMFLPESDSASGPTFFLCPTSGRYVYIEYTSDDTDDDIRRIIVDDLF